MVSFWVAVITAFVGAAAAGLIPWLQTTRDQVTAAKMARNYLIGNLRAADERLSAALREDANWWWPPVAAPPTGAWHEYRAVLHDDLGESSGLVAKTIDKLDVLNAWAVTQHAQQAMRLDIARQAHQTLFPRLFGASLDKLQPSYDLGDTERSAIQEARALVEETLERVRAAPSRVANRRRWRMWRLILPAVLAIGVAVIVAIATQPTFTSDKLDRALAKQFPGAAVSCHQLNGQEAQWDCFVAYLATRVTAASAQRLLAAQSADHLKFADAAVAWPRLRQIDEWVIEEQGKTNNFFGQLVGQAPPVKKGLPLRSDGLPSAPEESTASDTITGSVN